LDHDIAPGGYAWIFHTGGDTAKVGVCYIQNDRHREHAADGMTIDDYLDRWLKADPRFEGATKIESKQHRGSAHIQRPGALSDAGFMAIGDTVPTVDPVWGEGIHKGMRSARAAAITADRCLTGERETDAEAMSLYDELWHSEVAPNADTRLLLTDLLYLAPNDRYDRFMRDLNDAGDETLARANDGEKRAMLRLLHLDDLPRLARLGMERLAG
jgi:digeranylgeranylglycerophospholipid reductase